MYLAYARRHAHSGAGKQKHSAHTQSPLLLASPPLLPHAYTHTTSPTAQTTTTLYQLTGAILLSWRESNPWHRIRERQTTSPSDPPHPTPPLHDRFSPLSSSSSSPSAGTGPSLKRHTAGHWAALSPLSLSGLSLELPPYERLGLQGLRASRGGC